MNSFFIISYVMLWAIVLVQSYFMVQAARAAKKARETPVLSPEETISRIMRGDHGVSKGRLFPQLQFETVQHGRIDLANNSKKGAIIAFASTSCEQCKLIYPIIKQFDQERQDISIMMLIDGPFNQVAAAIEKYDIPVPVTQITKEDMARLETGFFPFVYYLNERGEVQTKGVVNVHEQLELLVEKGQML
ncbi:redoxin domain-containing protein [Paenibacillus assamensis]|uniref:redoxin domain-containing protein n=1 Tax=Paenibacillus assamensis TaxID=311244 RepID=UPI0004143D4B|nr:redoxin domain-containing protein [Paenibacillus assamensis]